MSEDLPDTLKSPLPDLSKLLPSLSKVLGQLNPQDRIIGIAVILIPVLVIGATPFLPEKTKESVLYVTVFPVFLISSLVWILTFLRSGKVQRLKAGFKNLKKENQKLKQDNLALSRDVSNAKDEFETQLSDLQERQSQIIQRKRQVLSSMHSQVESTRNQINSLHHHGISNIEAEEIKAKLSDLAIQIEQELDIYDRRSLELADARKMDDIDWSIAETVSSQGGNLSS